MSQNWQKMAKKKSKFRLGGACGEQRCGVLLRSVLNIENVGKATHCCEAWDRRQKKSAEKGGNEVVDSIVLTDNIAEWVDTILDDAAPLDPKELSSLATASLKTARKAKDYRSEVLFASLADFYRWMPRMGRLRAALRMAQFLSELDLAEHAVTFQNG
ncbi:hypothetical protein B0H10DRAFT_1950628 [Mycena sp. CBHHK59/15]|nr:hypothetical protein B0H10DRAFT_1950628 [Mycena sp. CBHHK59/15]